MDFMDLELFLHELRLTFDLQRLVIPHVPIEVSAFDVNLIKPFRVNHYLIKPSHSNGLVFGDIKDKHLIELIDHCFEIATFLKLPTYDRYCYLTIDSTIVKAFDTQGAKGWHLDGLQGDEVREKKEPDWQFVLCNQLPTLFTTQKFNPHWNISKDNIFEAIERQIVPAQITTFPVNSILLMNSYCAHAAAKALYDVDRTFIRINFTKVPVTSMKMTVNPNANYDYPIHSTSGLIPKHLK